MLRSSEAAMVVVEVVRWPWLATSMFFLDRLETVAVDRVDSWGVAGEKERKASQLRARWLEGEG